MNDTMYQVMPPLTADEYAELKSDIEQRGVMVPIEYDEHGNVLDGHHRLQICAELGITDFPTVIRKGMTEAEKRTHARKLNMARRQLSREQRKHIIDDALRENPEKSDRQIGRELGVDNKTVASRRDFLEAGEEIPHLDTTTGADGKQYPRQVDRKSTPVTDDEVDRLFQEMGDNDDWEEDAVTDDDVKSALYALDELTVEHPVLSSLIPEKPSLNDLLTTYDGDGTFYEHAKTAVEPSEQHKPHVSFNSGNNEWYTPADIIEAARKTMGGIDLDPATSEVAQEVVKANTYYTAKTNGLDKPWGGRVWMNPPYASELIGQFVDKLVSELPNIEQAIVLVNNATETEWFNKLVDKATVVCFPKSRIKFYMPDGKTGAPLQGQAILYFGDNASAFSNEFKNKGWLASIV